MKLVQVGDILEATVTSAEPFGLFVDSDGTPGLLLIHELSWERIRHPADVAVVGDSVKLKVIHLVDPPMGDSIFTGSIKALHPELNPWRDASVYRVGKAFSGIVEFSVSYGMFIRHPAGALALLRSNNCDSATVDVGTSVNVVITRVDENRQTIEVEFV